jgi:hypothetical protein
MGFKFFQKDKDAEFERMLQLHFPSDGPPNPDALTRYDPELHGPLTDEEIIERDEVNEILSRMTITDGEVPQSETLRRYDPDFTLPPAVFVSILRNRNTIDDNEFNFILEQQRRNLMEYMWEQGMIVQTIVSQDIDGFTLRTEINL